MSGGVGPCKDIGLMKEPEPEPEPAAEPYESSTAPRTTTATPLPRRRHHHLLSLRQLNALTAIVVLSASGMVAPEDVAFSIFTFLYIVFLSKFAFPAPAWPFDDTPLFDDHRTLLTIHAALGVLLGLVLPVAYILEGTVEGDKEGVKAATPHAFLLATQIFTEGVARGSSSFSHPVRAFVVVFYNAKRLLAIEEWLASEMGKAEERRVHIGRWLAGANLAFWSLNLFGFLIPFYLPRAFKRYYGYKEKA